jgi:hypothetical protein
MSPKSLGIWIVGADGDRKRFIVRADERLTAFAKLEMGPLLCKAFWTIIRTAEARQTAFRN